MAQIPSVKIYKRQIEQGENGKLILSSFLSYTFANQEQLYQNL